ncbi:hypothetical protein F4604DRAFT_1679686 [Suillus subluteus]|nr:hypothetical protein F4604DRAFT_1679686 [Suillus subluteus]
MFENYIGLGGLEQQPSQEESAEDTHETQECLEVAIICVKEIASQILWHMKEGCAPVQEQGETSSGADEQGLVIDLQAYRMKVERSRAGNFSKIFKTSSFRKGQYGDGIAESAVLSVGIYEKCSETWKIWSWGASQLMIRLAITGERDKERLLGVGGEEPLRNFFEGLAVLTFSFS